MTSGPASRCEHSSERDISGSCKRNASVQYECWQCSREGRTTEPTAIIVLAFRIFRVVKLAHAACADSQIIEVDATAMRAVAGRTAARQHGQQVRGAGGQLRCAESHLAMKRLA